MINRKTFLEAIGFTSLGGLLGYFTPKVLTPVPAGMRPIRTGPDVPKPQMATPAEETYSQAGEDRIVSFMFAYIHNNEPIDYLDIGAYHPTMINNTYFFYKRGATGVLVEPNVSICKLLREVRPRDIVLEAGIGITAEREADYYMMTEPSWNTFSKEEAEHQEKITDGRIRIKEVVKMPLYDINQVMADHFGGRAPAYLSIDAEGIHFEILKSVDFSRFRPKIICIETLVSGTTKTIPEIEAFMKEKNYVARGATFVNTIFIDNEILTKIEAERKSS